MPDLTAHQLNAPRAVLDPEPYDPRQAIMLTFHLRYLPAPEQPGNDVDPPHVEPLDDE